MKKTKKKTSFLHKILVALSILSAILLAIAFIMPYIEPKTLNGFAAFNLLTPILILVNAFFLIFWLLTFKRYFLIPLVLFIVGYPNIVRLYKVSGKKIIQIDDVKIMSYNVRMFNKYEWSDDKKIPEKITDFIKDKAPDILSFQDYAVEKKVILDFPYKFIKLKTEKSQFGQAIYSKYPILKKGSLDFEQTANNIIWVDLKIGKDTVRVYNVHLQSVKLNPKLHLFGEKDAEHLQMRISTAFQRQQEQVEIFLKHQATVKYPIIITGDFNNTAFSWVYRQMLKGKNDAFAQAGSGFDKTYNIDFPMRIDFVLVDKKYKINFFKTYREPFSDHFPILTRLDKNSFEGL